MTNLSPAPRRYPLILILIGTTILALPAAFGTLALFDSSTQSPSVGEPVGASLFFISLVGFCLFAGYILTAALRRHSAFFWFFSAFYNLGLSLCYFYIFYLAFKSVNSMRGLLDIFTHPGILLPFWTVFVTVSSGYYCKFALFQKKTDLV